MTERNAPCWCGSGKKWKKCHYPEQPKIEPAANLRDLYRRRHQIALKTPEQIDGIRRACRLASDILDRTCQGAIAGVTTQELNDYAHQLHLAAGAIPAPLHYGSPPFPKSICTSLNDVVCHGIPNKTKLVDGDILNVDITCILDSYFGDCSRMVSIGKLSPERHLVVDVAYDCLMKAIDALKPGEPISVIGDAIQTHADFRGCSVVHQFVGHGIGMKFHENPQIPHYRNQSDIRLVPGMTFTIEPMINAGVADAIIDADDHWTARTADGRASAQWEHTVLITDDGHEVLTTWKRS